MSARVARVARRALRVSAGEKSEDEIHEAVVAELRKAGVRFFHAPNESNVPVQYRAKLARKGLQAGVPDLVITQPNRWGRPSALELKRPGGRVSEAQSTWIARAEIDGWTCAVAYGLEDALETLRTWGYLDPGLSRE